MTGLSRASEESASGVPGPGKIRSIGVVGAGTIGRSVAQALAQTGHDVILVDTSAEVLETAAHEIVASVRLHHLVAGTPQRQDPGAVMSRVVFSTHHNDLAGIGFVIENATEAWTTKKQVYRQLDEVCSEDCIWGANTSAFPITKIGSLTDRGSQVVGMHFMNPVPLKAVVEVIRGRETTDSTIRAALTLLSQMGKRGILVEDSPGFVSNRVLMLEINEAILLVQEEVAAAATVDEIFRECFGHAMGPLETADLIGLDTVLRTLRVLHKELGGSRFGPCRLLEEMVVAGMLGRKSGRGFHEYGGATGRKDGA